jgi:hypothetical protein
MLEWQYMRISRMNTKYTSLLLFFKISALDYFASGYNQNSLKLHFSCSGIAPIILRIIAEINAKSKI